MGLQTQVFLDANVMQNLSERGGEKRKVVLSL